MIDAGPRDPRLDRLRRYIQSRPDLKLARVKAMVAEMRAVTPGQKQTAAAVFGPTDPAPDTGDFFQHEPQPDAELSPRVLGASEQPTKPPVDGGIGSYAKQYAAGAAGGLARFVPAVAIQTARDLHRTERATAELMQGTPIRTALERATQQTGGGVLEPIPSTVKGGSIYERGMGAVDRAVTGAQDRMVGKPADISGQTGRELGETVGGLLPLLPAVMAGGASIVNRSLNMAGKVKRSMRPVEPPPPEPEGIHSDAQPFTTPVEPAPTTSIRTIQDVLKDMQGAKRAQAEAMQRGVPALAAEYQQHVYKLMKEAKSFRKPVVSDAELTPPPGGPPEPPAAGQKILKPTERRTQPTAAKPELGLYTRGQGEPIPPKPTAAEQMGKTPEEMEQILHPSKGLDPGVVHPKQRASVEKITNEAMEQSAVDELVGEQTARPVEDVNATLTRKTQARLDDLLKNPKPDAWTRKQIQALQYDLEKLAEARAPGEQTAPSVPTEQKPPKLFKTSTERAAAQPPEDRRPSFAKESGDTEWPKPGEHLAGRTVHREVKPGTPFEEGYAARDVHDVDIRIPKLGDIETARTEQGTVAPGRVIYAKGETVRVMFEDGTVNSGHFDDLFLNFPGKPKLPKVKGNARKGVPAPKSELQSMDLDALEKEFVRLDNKVKRTPAEEARHKALDQELTNRDYTGADPLPMERPADRAARGRAGPIDFDNDPLLEKYDPRPRVNPESRYADETHPQALLDASHRQAEEHFARAQLAIRDLASERSPETNRKWTPKQVQAHKAALADARMRYKATLDEIEDAFGEEARAKIEAEIKKKHVPPDEPPPAGPSGSAPKKPVAPSPETTAAPSNPKYKKLDDQALLERRHEIVDRIEETQPKIELNPYSRPNQYNEASHTGMVLGKKGDKGATGRALGRLKDDGRILDEIEIELKARGISDQVVTDAYEAHTTAKAERLAIEQEAANQPIRDADGNVLFSFPGPIKATTAIGALAGGALGASIRAQDDDPDDWEVRVNRGIAMALVGAFGVAGMRRMAQVREPKLTMKEVEKFESHLERQLTDFEKSVTPETLNEIDKAFREVLGKLQNEAIDKAVGKTFREKPPEKADVVLPPKPRWNLNEKGGTNLLSHGAIPGAAIGAALGAAASDDENKVGGALTGALAGAYAGHILTRASLAHGAKAVFQRASQDPDIAAVLSISATPRTGALRTLAGAKAAFVAGVRSSYQAMLDDVYAARRFGREVGGSERVSDEASRARGWRGFGDELIGRTKPWRQYRLFSYLPTLRKAVAAAKGHEADVIALTRAERAIELENAGMGWKLEGHATRQQASATIQKLTVIPEVRRAADQLRAFYDYLYELRYKNGLISAAEYAATKAKHTQFVSFLRDFGNEAGANAGSAGGKLFMRGSTVRKMEAGIASSPIVDPFEQAAQDAYRVARAVSRQRVFNVINDIVRKDAAAASPWLVDFGKKGQAKIPNGYEGRTIEARVDGELHVYGINDYDFYNALAAITPQSRDIAHWLLTLPKKTLQAGTTIVPSFGAANASRDAFFTSLSYGYPVRAALAGAAGGAAAGAYARPDDRLEGAAIGAGLGLGAGAMSVHAARIVKAFGSIARNDDLYQMWKREGGSGAGYFVQTKQDAERAVAMLRHDHVTPLDLINPKTWWEALENFNRMVEEAPRVAKFDSELNAGKKPLASAITTSRGVSLDFSRHGGSNLARLGGEMSAFWNPKLQGLDKLREVFFGANKGRAYALGLTTMTAPTIALWMINKDDPEYQRRPLYEKMLAWHIPIGKDERGVTRYFLLPKPFEPGYVFASLPQLLLDFSYRKDKERTLAGLKQIAGSVGEGLLPIPTAAAPILENRAGKQGYSQFRGRPIVDDALAKLPPREQIDSRTSTAAIALSRAAELGSFGLYSPSPKKVDNVIQGWTGKGGRTVTTKIDELLHVTGLSKRPVAPAANTSQWSRFVSQEAGFNTDDIQTLFRQYEASAQHLEQVKRLAKEGDIAGAQKYARDHRSDLIAARMYAKAVERYRKIARGRRQIENSRTLSAEEKRDQIAELGEKASALAKAFVDARLKITRGVH